MGGQGVFSDFKQKFKLQEIVHFTLHYRKNVLDLVVSYLVADFKNNEHYQSSPYFYVLFYRLESRKQGINKNEMVRMSIF